MIEADLLSVYGVDLNELGSHRLTWRRLSVLLAQAPRTSRIARAVHGPPAAWGEAEHLLADLWDALVAVNTPKGKTPPAHERPKVVKRTLLTPQEVDERLLALRDKE